MTIGTIDEPFSEFETKSQYGALWFFFGISIEINSCLDQYTLDTYTTIV